MNLIFLSIFEEFQNFFKDGFLSKINTEGLEGSNARELVKSYFENNQMLRGWALSSQSEFTLANPAYKYTIMIKAWIEVI